MSRLSFQVGPLALKRWNAGLRPTEASVGPSIDIYDVIGEDPWSGGGVTLKDISSQLSKIGAQDITVNINSPGGSFFEGLAIYNTFREHKGAVNVRVMGLAASAASVIAMAGKNIKVASSGFLMIHNAWGLVMGNKEDLLRAATELEKFDSSMAEVYSARSGATLAQTKAWMAAETWFDGNEAVAAKLADGLLDADTTVLSAEVKTDVEATAEFWERSIAARRLGLRKLTAA